MNIIVLICTYKSSRNKARTRHFNRQRSHWWQVRCGSQKRALCLWSVVREVCVYWIVHEPSRKWNGCSSFKETWSLSALNWAQLKKRMILQLPFTGSIRDWEMLVLLISGRCPRPWGLPQVLPSQCLWIWAYLAYICLFQCGSFGFSLNSFYSWLLEEATC